MLETWLLETQRPRRQVLESSILFFLFFFSLVPSFLTQSSITLVLVSTHSLIIHSYSFIFTTSTMSQSYLSYSFRPFLRFPTLILGLYRISFASFFSSFSSYSYSIAQDWYLYSIVCVCQFVRWLLMVLSCLYTTDSFIQ